jgi:hypothetical protein
MIVRPFHELKCAYQRRFQPPAIFHLRCGKPGFRLRQIRERAFGCLKRTKTAPQFLAQCRGKATASPRRTGSCLRISRISAHRMCCRLWCIRRLQKSWARLTRIFCQAPQRLPVLYWLSRCFAASPSRPCAFTERIRSGRVASSEIEYRTGSFSGGRI